VCGWIHYRDLCLQVTLRQCLTSRALPDGHVHFPLGFVHSPDHPSLLPAPLIAPILVPGGTGTGDSYYCGAIPRRTGLCARHSWGASMRVPVFGVLARHLLLLMGGPRIILQEREGRQCRRPDRLLEYGPFKIEEHCWDVEVSLLCIDRRRISQAGSSRSRYLRQLLPAMRQLGICFCVRRRSLSD